jgi:hypothetical protein
MSQSDKPFYDPRDKVGLTRVEKKGDYYRVEGVVEGKKVHAHIPSPSVDGQSRANAEALMRRGLLGTKRLEDPKG